MLTLYEFAPAKRVPADIPSAAADFKAAGKVLQAELAGREYVVGDRFTVADVVLAHTLIRSTWNDLLDDLPSLQAYMKRHLLRPSCPEALRGG